MVYPGSAVVYRVLRWFKRVSRWFCGGLRTSRQRYTGFPRRFTTFLRIVVLSFDRCAYECECYCLTDVHVSVNEGCWNYYHSSKFLKIISVVNRVIRVIIPFSKILGGLGCLG